MQVAGQHSSHQSGREFFLCNIKEKINKTSLISRHRIIVRLTVIGRQRIILLPNRLTVGITVLDNFKTYFLLWHFCWKFIFIATGTYGSPEAESLARRLGGMVNFWWFLPSKMKLGDKVGLSKSMNFTRGLRPQTPITLNFVEDINNQSNLA